jgi:RhtB (resistance to homoserine/threonine) family protein
MQYLPEFLAIAFIHLLAVMSPGPDFALITRSSIVYSRRTAVLSALGLGLGILLHVTYSLLGIGLIISQSIMLFTVLKLLGAAYLLFIGWKSLHAKPHTIQDDVTDAVRERDLTQWQAVRMGFLTNALNPKVTIFFVAVFVQVIDPSTPIAIKALYGAEMSFMTFVWFGFIATMFSHRWIKQKVRGIQHHIERITGVALILFGLKLAFSKAR